MSDLLYIFSSKVPTISFLFHSSKLVDFLILIHLFLHCACYFLFISRLRLLISLHHLSFKLFHWFCTIFFLGNGFTFLLFIFSTNLLYSILTTHFYPPHVFYISFSNSIFFYYRWEMREMEKVSIWLAALKDLAYDTTNCPLLPEIICLSFV